MTCTPAWGLGNNSYLQQPVAHNTKIQSIFDGQNQVPPNIIYIFYIYTYIYKVTTGKKASFCFMPTLMTTGLSKNLCKTWWSMIQESFIPFPQPMSQIRFLFSDLEKVTNHTFSVLILWYLVIFICIHLDHTTNTLDPIISSFLNLSSLTFFHHAGLHLQSINSSC